MNISITELADKEKILPIITETVIKYKKPFFLENTVHVEVWVSEMMNVSAIFEFRFLNEKGELCSMGQQKVLFIDKDTQRPSRKIVKFKDKFQKFLN